MEISTRRRRPVVEGEETVSAVGVAENAVAAIDAAPIEGKAAAINNAISAVEAAVGAVKKTVRRGGGVPSEERGPTTKVEYDWKNTLSTGSTLLDLAISGGRKRGGGVPGGILVEIYGRSGSGKTSILSELCGSAQAKEGDIMFLDPEARLDAAHAQVYGMNIPKDKYFKPNTVSEMFGMLSKWKPDGKHINVLAADSLAALSTELEMEKGDKMGMRRAKEFSEGLRKTCRVIEENNWLIACSNQVRQGDYGDVTPGGKAVEFYSSLRLSVNRTKVLEVKKMFHGKEIVKAIGIESKCKVEKSSLDLPFRFVPIYIVFEYGIDDIRGNLQWSKDVTGATTYNAVNKEFQQMSAALNHIEKYELEDALRESVIDLWYEIEEKFKQPRKKKSR